MKIGLTQILGIRYPILQTSMAWIADAELAGAVSAAGALATLEPNCGARQVTRDIDEHRMQGEIL